MGKTLKEQLSQSPLWSAVDAGIGDSSEICPFCGNSKKEFINPLADKLQLPHLELVPCACERQFKMLNEFLEINFEWLKWPQGKVIDVPDYSKGENTAERQKAQWKFVQGVKRKRDEMTSQSARLKWQLEQTHVNVANVDKEQSNLRG
jgi:hypothetical protein